MWVCMFFMCKYQITHFRWMSYQYAFAFVFKRALYKNANLYTLHMHGFSAVCVLIWVLKLTLHMDKLSLPCVFNVELHTLNIWFFTSMCTCFIKLELQGNAWPHTLCEYSFSLVFTCDFITLNSEKFPLHIPKEQGFSAVCIHLYIINLAL